MGQKHYTPPLSRFLVWALYHEAKARGIPMTQLATTWSIWRGILHQRFNGQLR